MQGADDTDKWHDKENVSHDSSSRGFLGSKGTEKGPARSQAPEHQHKPGSSHASRGPLQLVRRLQQSLRRIFADKEPQTATQRSRQPLEQRPTQQEGSQKPSEGGALTTIAAASIPRSNAPPTDVTLSLSALDSDEVGRLGAALATWPLQSPPSQQDSLPPVASAEPWQFGSLYYKGTPPSSTRVAPWRLSKGGVLAPSSADSPVLPQPAARQSSRLSLSHSQPAASAAVLPTPARVAKTIAGEVFSPLHRKSSWSCCSSRDAYGGPPPILLQPQQTPPPLTLRAHSQPDRGAAGALAAGSSSYRTLSQCPVMVAAAAASAADRPRMRRRSTSATGSLQWRCTPVQSSPLHAECAAAEAAATEETSASKRRRVGGPAESVFASQATAGGLAPGMQNNDAELFVTPHSSPLRPHRKGEAASEADATLTDADANGLPPPAQGAHAREGSRADEEMPCVVWESLDAQACPSRSSSRSRGLPLPALALAVSPLCLPLQQSRRRRSSLGLVFPLTGRSSAPVLPSQDLQRQSEESPRQQAAEAAPELSAQLAGGSKGASAEGSRSSMESKGCGGSTDNSQERTTESGSSFAAKGPDSGNSPCGEGRVAHTTAGAFEAATSTPDQAVREAAAAAAAAAAAFLESPSPGSTRKRRRCTQDVCASQTAASAGTLGETTAEAAARAAASQSELTPAKRQRRRSYAGGILTGAAARRLLMQPEAETDEVLASLGVPALSIEETRALRQRQQEEQRLLEEKREKERQQQLLEAERLRKLREEEERRRREQEAQQRLLQQQQEKLQKEREKLEQEQQKQHQQEKLRQEEKKLQQEQQQCTSVASQQPLDPKQSQQQQQPPQKLFTHAPPVGAFDSTVKAPEPAAPRPLLTLPMVPTAGAAPTPAAGNSTTEPMEGTGMPKAGRPILRILRKKNPLQQQQQPQQPQLQQQQQPQLQLQ
ncbi:serine/arginine repetitive matrix protein 2, partial [Cyclospora cayetanensis]|uniref:Serine/arginine repetitive matrix protein 2 n=1 Tax=Cyclospora cayetanensis TaxID=88456 RepID=A0A6P6RQI3_9EIME